MDDGFDIGLGAIFRLIKALVKDFLFDIVCYIVGWFSLRVITVGKYPSEGLGDGLRGYGLKDDGRSEALTSAFGLLIIVIGSFVLFK